MKIAWTIFVVALIALFSYGLGTEQHPIKSYTINNPYIVGDTVFTITGGTFDVNLTFVITTDTIKAKKLIRENIVDSVNMPFGGRGFSTNDGQGNMIIYMPVFNATPEDMALLNHELSHTTIAIMQWAGVPLLTDIDEVYAYELAYLTLNFYNSVNRFGL